MDDPEGGFMEYIEEIQEQVILVGVQLDENDNVKESLDELEELADTAGDDKKTFSASAFKGILASCCNNVISFLSILSITHSQLSYIFPLKRKKTILEKHSKIVSFDSLNPVINIHLFHHICKFF
jgi:hypothetical protein